jgi:hypothetical protein
MAAFDAAATAGGRPVMGLVVGVTTNPSLVARTGRKFKDVLLEICDREGAGLVTWRPAEESDRGHLTPSASDIVAAIRRSIVPM